MFVSDIVESNGKTVKQNNLGKQHKIPLGSLVEVNMGEDSEDGNGLRLYVVEHSRDCDGTPLYDLSFDKDYASEKKEHDSRKMNGDYAKDVDYGQSLKTYTEGYLAGQVSRHYSEDSLTVIKYPLMV